MNLTWHYTLEDWNEEEVKRRALYYEEVHIRM